MSQTRKGLLLILSGPSGVGKGTVGKALMARNPNIRFSVSCTTRAPRPGEVNGLHYFFISEEEFCSMVEEGAFLEHTKVFGAHYYGTPRAYVEQHLLAGEDILLDIDVQGALNVKKCCPDAVMMFLAPPSMSALKSRLVGRGTESQEAVERRFHEAFAELSHVEEYDYLIVNDVLDKAVMELEQVIAAERLRVSRNGNFIARFHVEGGQPL
ncbi:MAG: guanylate kinase [Candidatus Pelethousia sp.]|nr:guanylate kinase [Candidatus Pelethousia sp.]